MFGDTYHIDATPLVHGVELVRTTDPAALLLDLALTLAVGAL